VKKLPKATLVVALLLVPAAAGADWLVLRDGARLETRGPAKVEGRRVLFTDATGTLMALPAADVDFDATAAANRPAPLPPEPRPAAKPVPVVRLTDADVSHVDDLARPTIEFYSASWCGWCRKSRALLDQLGARYRERDVDQDPRANEEKNRLAPGSGVPVIAFEEMLLTGYTERGIRRMVERWRAAESAAEEAHEASRRPAGAPPARAE